MIHMSNFERRFGKYAIPNLTLILIIGYAIGYLMQFVNSTFLGFLTLDPYKIIHGQVWRIFTWLLIPPSGSNILFILLMLWCCYSIGTVLERTWGTYKYNVFIISGILLTVVLAFTGFGVECLRYGYDQVAQLEQNNLYVSEMGHWIEFSTYYINVSIYMVFAMTYPNNTVLIYFILPVKMKWMGIIDLVYMGYLLIVGDVFTKLAVAAALINCAFFYVANIRGISVAPQQIKRRVQYNRNLRGGGNFAKGSPYSSGPSAPKMNPSGITRHKCAICGKTEVTDPGMEFRFCSKCNGNYEYCSTHLFTHKHVE
ncbi:MAG: hypothetical protein IKS07_03625 [Lachnospiraceae bacterium]|nr:hypothetical protein [Lachnospiraceae bacterium]